MPGELEVLGKSVFDMLLKDLLTDAWTLGIIEFVFNFPIVWGIGLGIDNAEDRGEAGVLN